MLANHRLQLWREKNTIRIAACAKFIAAFDPILGQIYLARNHGDHDRPSIEDFVKYNLLAHASAVEEFRPFVAGKCRVAYQEAWENYRKIANDACLAVGADWADNLPEGKTLETCIHAILRFAKT